MSYAVELRASATPTVTVEAADALPLLGTLEHSSSGGDLFRAWASIVDSGYADLLTRLAGTEELPSTGHLPAPEVTAMAALLDALVYAATDPEEFGQWHDALSYSLFQAGRAGTGVLGVYR